MLLEKKRYKFRVLRLLTLPDDSRSWLLTHDGEDRYLLPAEYYGDYGIVAGNEIICRIDKINCTGRIFLEPENPFYREKHKYRFSFLREEPLEGSGDSNLKRLIFAGVNDDIHSSIIHSDTVPLNPGDDVDVIINKIKKGRLFFEPLCLAEQVFMREGEVYQFKATGISKENILDAQGPGGVMASLDLRHYRDHGLFPGRVFRAHFRKWNEKGYPLIEPEHPFYKPGETYTFRVLREELPDHHYKDKLQVLIVEDCFRNEIKVFTGQSLNESGKLPGEVLCRVERLKKGMPVLKII